MRVDAHLVSEKVENVGEVLTIAAYGWGQRLQRGQTEAFVSSETRRVVKVR